MKKLTVNQARNAANTSPNALLIDCRPKEDYAHGHVGNAINFPIDKITEERVCHRIPDKETALYIIGRYYDQEIAKDPSLLLDDRVVKAIEDSEKEGGAIARQLRRRLDAIRSSMPKDLYDM